MDLHALKEGSKVTAGTVLGEIGKTDDLAPHVHFEIQPAGRGAPKIDPKPILDGWKLLEATAIYRAAGKNPFDGTATASQVLLMSKGQLIQRALSDPNLSIYACGREDIRSGADRPARPGDARVPRRPRLRPDDHLAQVRPLGHDHLGQRLRALDRLARWTSPRSTVSRSSATRAPARSPTRSSATCSSSRAR